MILPAVTFDPWASVIQHRIARQAPETGEEGPTGTRVHEIITTAVVCGFLCALSVALRIFAIRLGNRRLKASDWLIFSAWVFVVGTQIVFGLGIDVGNGKHFQYVTSAKALQTNFNLEAILYNLAICLIKLSNLALYASIFPQVVFRRWLWGVGSVVVAWCIATQVVAIFPCIPVAAGWDPSLQPGARCVNAATLSIISSVVGIVTDFAVLILPIPLVLQLQLKNQLKAIVIGVFVVGSCACIVTIVRLPLTVHLARSDDLSYDATSVWVTIHVELTVGLFATSLPAYRPFLPHISRAFNLGWRVGSGTPDHSSDKKRPKRKAGNLGPINSPNPYYPSDVGNRHTTHIRAIRKAQDRADGLISVTRDVELLSVPRRKEDRSWMRMNDSYGEGEPDDHGNGNRPSGPTSS